MTLIQPPIDEKRIFQKTQINQEIFRAVLREMYQEYYKNAKTIYPRDKSFADNIFIINELTFENNYHWSVSLLQEIKLKLIQLSERYNQYPQKHKNEIFYQLL